MEFLLLYLVIGFMIGINMVFGGKYTLKRHGKSIDDIGNKLWMLLIITVCWPKGFIDSL